MSDHRAVVTDLLHAMQSGDPGAAQELLPIVYDELRSLARARLARLPAGQTLQPTALVHEAYLRIVGDDDPGWDGRWHFFGAAARSMRDILVDQTRRKASIKRGGARRRVPLDADATPAPEIAAPTEDLLALHEAIARLEREDPRKAELVMLRYFAGLKRAELAAALGVTVRTIDREWRYVIARLHMELYGDEGPAPGAGLPTDLES